MSPFHLLFTVSLRKSLSVQNVAQIEAPWEGVTLNRCLFIAITILVLSSGCQRLHGDCNVLTLCLQIPFTSHICFSFCYMAQLCVFCSMFLSDLFPHWQLKTSSQHCSQKHISPSSKPLNCWKLICYTYMYDIWQWQWVLFFFLRVSKRSQRWERSRAHRSCA